MGTQIMDTGPAVSAVLGTNDQSQISVLAGGRLEQLLCNVLSWFLSSGCFDHCWREGIKTKHFASKRAVPCREVCRMQGSGLWLRMIAHCYLHGCISYKQVG